MIRQLARGLVLTVFFLTSAHASVNSTENKLKKFNNFELLDSNQTEPIGPGFRLKPLVSAQGASIKKLSRGSASSGSNSSTLGSLGSSGSEEFGPPLAHLWAKVISEQSPSRMSSFLQNCENYREVVSEILKKADVPEKFYSLPILLSGYQVHYVSGNRAGIWAITPEVARRYGLRISKNVDERFDPIRSTRVFGKHLKDLHRVFQSWELALTATVTGERRLLSVLMHANKRGFWELLNAGDIEGDAQYRYPLFLASQILAKDPTGFGLEKPMPFSWKSLQVMKVPSGISLRQLALDTGVSLDEIRRLNPHLRSLESPNFSDSYSLWVARK